MAVLLMGKWTSLSQGWILIRRNLLMGGQRNWMTLQLPGCSSFGELETVGQKFVSESRLPSAQKENWAHERKLFHFPRLCDCLSEGKGKADPPEFSVCSLWKDSPTKEPAILRRT